MSEEKLPNAKDLTDEELELWYLCFLEIQTPEAREMIETHVLQGKTPESLFENYNEQLPDGHFELLKACFRWRRDYFAALLMPFIHFDTFRGYPVKEVKVHFPDGVDLIPLLDKPKPKKRKAKAAAKN